MTVLAALGAVSSILEIVSFFGPDAEAEDRQAKFDELSDLVSGNTFLLEIEQQTRLAESLATSRTALDVLRSYETERDADVRRDLAIEAEILANLGLNDLIGEIEPLLRANSLDTMAYALHALPEAMAIRMEVSAAVADGPMGTAGLRAKIKQAADLIYNEDGRPNVVDAIRDTLVNDISDDFEDASFTVSAPLSPIVTDTLTGRVTVSSEYGGTQEQVIGPFVANRLAFTDHPDQERFDRDVFNAERALISQNLSNALTATQYSELQAFGRAIHDSLGAVLGDVATHDRSFTTGADIAEGTLLADYLLGDDGDDVLNGLAGPDAVSGGSGNDILRGGEGEDYIAGGAGSDMVFGGATYDDALGGDTVRIDGLQRDFAVEGGKTYAKVVGPNGDVDKLFNIDFLRFDDGLFELSEGSALDGAGDPAGFNVAERVALLYEAALNRDGDIDLPGLNFYIGVTEANNLTDEFLARDLMTSPEFSASFGDVETLSNEEFLQQVYTNVLERDPDIDGFLFYLNLLNEEVITKELALADIAISPENTEASGEILMSLFETSDGGWSFV